MAHKPSWASKVMALLQAGNAAAAIAQIQVAPSVKDLNALAAAIAAAGAECRWKNVDAALRDATAALSAPRLHRAP